MESIRLPFKNDAFGNAQYCRVSWTKTESDAPRPIALVYHAGGLLVGSSEIIPKAQTAYLASKGFVVVAPNYRLAPQATARESFRDAEDAYEWATSALSAHLQTAQPQSAPALDPSKVVTMGHSVGGTLALHVAARKPVGAVTALYPTLHASDPTTSIHAPTSAPPFGTMPDFHPTPADWAQITPADAQVSEWGFAAPGTVPAPRNRWQMHVLKHGEAMAVLCPDGDFAIMDPLAGLAAAAANGAWPPTRLVQGDADTAPGSGLAYARKAEADLRAAGVEVALEIVAGAPHMFDLPPSVGTTDVGDKWAAVVAGMDWLCARV